MRAYRVYAPTQSRAEARGRRRPVQARPALGVIPGASRARGLQGGGAGPVLTSTNSLRRLGHAPSPLLPAAQLRAPQAVRHGPLGNPPVRVAPRSVPPVAGSAGRGGSGRSRPRPRAGLGPWLRIDNPQTPWISGPRGSEFAPCRKTTLEVARAIPAIAHLICHSCGARGEAQASANGSSATRCSCGGTRQVVRIVRHPGGAASPSPAELERNVQERASDETLTPIARR